MNTLQFFVVALIIGCAVIYAVRRVRHTLHQNKPCCGCEGCEMCEEKRKQGCNQHCCDKK